MQVNITEEQAKALQALKYEMLTQDHDCQAAPRYWIITQIKPEYNVVEDDADATFIKDVDGDIVVAAPGELPSLLELIESRREDILDKNGYTAMTTTLKDDAVYISLTDEEGDIEEEKVADCDDAAEFLNNQLSPDPWRNEYSVGWVRFDRVPVKGPLFLTKKAAEEHIAKYGYNYNDPRPYALTASRSPEAELLWKLVEETEWYPEREITREMVEAAYDENIILIEDGPDGGTVACIGEHWFYFGGYPAQEMTATAYKKRIPSQYIIEFVYQTLRDLRADGNVAEYDYYYFYMKEQLDKKLAHLAGTVDDKGFWVNPDIDMTKIPDSLLLRSGQEIASLKKDGFLAVLEVRGEILIEWTEEDGHVKECRDPSEYPDELKQLIVNAKSAADLYSDPRVNLRNNNWFEAFVYEGEDDHVPWAIIVDAENSTKRELYELLDELITRANE